MEPLIALRSIRSGNELLKAGDKFLIDDGQGLIDRGYARRLTQKETKNILAAYVQEAERLFNGKSEPRAQVRPTHEQGILFTKGIDGDLPIPFMGGYSRP